MEVERYLRKTINKFKINYANKTKSTDLLFSDWTYHLIRACFKIILYPKTTLFLPGRYALCIDVLFHYCLPIPQLENTKSSTCQHWYLLFD